MTLFLIGVRSRRRRSTFPFCMAESYIWSGVEWDTLFVNQQRTADFGECPSAAEPKENSSQGLSRGVELQYDALGTEKFPNEAKLILPLRAAPDFLARPLLRISCKSLPTVFVLPRQFAKPTQIIHESENAKGTHGTRCPRAGSAAASHP